ncbi:RDD family protein [Bradyrhizobium sp. CCGUVB4N]|uniref:RDD family protein n=1 Tax=Bradyrhizobium sp. CCGUVB4N TaxID=2949631 RepID=UPI0020B33F3E|nr:RDD family protein [Bradyrhizobium sp. CCGUVB4N]MCP3379557.1 RDD family protein [Bradyrhizobium sp. CCGUVB4N]
MNPNAPAAPDVPRYARFSRRLKAILLDWMLAMALIFGALAVAANVESNALARVLGVGVVLILLLYEPLLVWWGGATLGHYWTNLRVVADDGGNLSFARALGRFALKSLLGWYSFLSMAATRRNQTVHDLLTRSTVQIRDPAKATPSQFITERREFDGAGTPSRLRRAAVTVAYLGVCFVLYVIALDLLLRAGILSRACFYSSMCTGGDRIVDAVAGIVFLVVLAFVLALGWRGQLLGARKA